MALKPISFAFVAAGVGNQAKAALYRLKNRSVSSSLNWNGRGETPTFNKLSTPITDPALWQDRYVLTELTFQNEAGETLTVNDAVVTVTKKYNVVSTSVVGLNGSIKEYVSESDADVSINVGIVAVDAAGNIVDEYPEEGLRTLRKFIDTNKSVKVASTFLDIWGISMLAISELSVSQETESNVQRVSIKASSDRDYQIVSEEY